MKKTSHKYTLFSNKMVKWRQLFFSVQSFFKKHCIFMKSHNQLPFYFGEHWIFQRSRFHLPYYFGEHCIFMRSCLYLPFYFGELCIFMRNCLHLPFFHVQSRWRKRYNPFYNLNRTWIISLNFGLFLYPFSTYWT